MSEIKRELYLKILGIFLLFVAGFGIVVEKNITFSSLGMILFGLFFLGVSSGFINTQKKR